MQGLLRTTNLLRVFIMAILSQSALAQVTRFDVELQAERVLEAARATNAGPQALSNAFQRLREVERVLLSGSPQGPGGSRQLFCEPRSSSYSYLTRVSDGFRFGSDVSNDVCLKLLNGARGNLVCGPRSSSYAYIYNITTGLPVGSDVDIDQCIGLVQASTRNVFCSPRSSSYAYVTRVSDSVQLGSDVDHPLCKRLVTTATPQLVCEPRSSSYAYITRIQTGEHLGSDLPVDQCIQRLGQF